LLLGPSSGLAIAAALDVARAVPSTSVVVVVAPDGGLNYLSTAYNDEWLAAAGIESRP
jgi:cystathionine beta-synthase/cysteine synthase A